MQVKITLHIVSKNIPKTTGLLSDELGPEPGPYIKVAEAEAGPDREWDHTIGSTPALIRAD